MSKRRSKFVKFRIHLGFGGDDHDEAPSAEELKEQAEERKAEQAERHAKRLAKLEDQRHDARENALEAAGYHIANRGTAGMEKAKAPSEMQSMMDGHTPLPPDAQAIYNKSRIAQHDEKVAARKAAKHEAAKPVAHQPEHKEEKVEHKEVPRPRGLRAAPKLTEEQQVERLQRKALRETGHAVRFVHHGQTNELMWSDKNANAHKLSDMPPDAEKKFKELMQEKGLRLPEEKHDEQLRKKALRQTGHTHFVNHAKTGEVMWTDANANAHSLKELPPDAEKRYQQLKQEPQAAPAEKKPRQSSKPSADTTYHRAAPKHVEPAAAGDVQALQGDAAHLVTAKDIMKLHGDTLRMAAKSPVAGGLTAEQMAAAMATMENASHALQGQASKFQKPASP